MSLSEKSHIIVFAIVLGSVAYLADVLWAAIFLVPLPNDEDAVVHWIEIQTGANSYKSHPGEFKNSIEELKYYNNVQMVERNTYWLGGLAIVGGAIGLFAFYVVPKCRNNLGLERDNATIAISGIVIGVLVVVITPVIIARFLPASDKWFPKVIVEYRDMREKEALERLELYARELDAE